MRMWTCICLCVYLQQFSLTIWVFLSLCISIVVENDKTCFVLHLVRQIVCMEELNEFDCESSCGAVQIW